MTKNTHTDNTVNASVDYDIDFYATGSGSFQQKQSVWCYEKPCIWLFQPYFLTKNVLWPFMTLQSDLWSDWYLKKKYPLLTNSLWLSPDKINAELNNGFQRNMLLIFDLTFVFNLLKILYLHTLFMKMSKALYGWRIRTRTNLI